MYTTQVYADLDDSALDIQSKSRNICYSLVGRLITYKGEKNPMHLHVKHGHGIDRNEQHILVYLSICAKHQLHLSSASASLIFST